jgi:hypothetical protein
MTEIWDLWYPKAGATGIAFGRGRMNATGTLLVHAAPPELTVTVRNDTGEVLAEGKNLSQTADTPITRLTRHGHQLERSDIWPDASAIGQLVLLAGGEVGVLKAWWHAADHSEWRWQIELYNHK